MLNGNISEIIRQLVSEFNGASPEQINNGQCDEFAWCIADEIPSVQVGEVLYSHFFVKLAGRYYDSECPQGVKRLKDLPVFQRDGKPPGKVIYHLGHREESFS